MGVVVVIFGGRYYFIGFCGVRVARFYAVGGVRRGVDDGFSGDFWGDIGVAVWRDFIIYRFIIKKRKFMDEIFIMCFIVKI